MVASELSVQLCSRARRFPLFANRSPPSKITPEVAHHKNTKISHLYHRLLSSSYACCIFPHFYCSYLFLFRHCPADSTFTVTNNYKKVREALTTNPIIPVSIFSHQPIKNLHLHSLNLQSSPTTYPHHNPSNNKVLCSL